LVIALINNFAIENMAIGGIGAYFVFYHKDTLMRSSIFSLQMQIMLFGLLFFYMSTNETIISISIVRSFYHILFSKSVLGLVFVPMLFLYVIINTSLNEKSIIRTESKVLNYMGNISYGIYIYHMIAIYMVEALMVKLKFQAGSIFFGAIFLILVFTINIAIASVSFKYFESIFLRMRPKEYS
jgi:peptidoglycan/LPS O-acetylase OafA/YrhL